jgi:hypothetical protein
VSENATTTPRSLCRTALAAKASHMIDPSLG